MVKMKEEEYHNIVASDKFTANANQTIYAGWKAGYLIEYNAMVEVER